MSLNSLEFCIFLIFVCTIYFLVPYKVKNIVLLFASYAFYAYSGWVHATVLLLIAVITYIVAFIINRTHKRHILAVGIVLNVLVLVCSKYSLYFGKARGGIFIIPVGISFYTLQAIGYLTDLYHNKVSFEQNFLIHSLFLSFFPCAVSGPIERAENMFKQFRLVHKFEYVRVCHGLQIFLWGGAVKLVLANRLAMISNELLSNPVKYIGWELVAGVIIYTLQIYCDFAAYSDMAFGVAKILGFDIIQNFKRPYFALNIADFWSRWHISLSSWLRDYVYIPLGGSRKGQLRKYFNLGIVFLISGLWHGTGWNYIFWGMLYVIYYILSGLSNKIWNRLAIKTAKMNPDRIEIRFLKRSITFFLVAFAWIFFYAQDMEAAINILKGIFAVNNIGVLFSGGRFSVGGMIYKDWIVIWIGLAVLLLVDMLREKKAGICNMLDQYSIWMRWPVYLGLITSIMVFGIYGPGYAPQAFIYQAF